MEIKYDKESVINVLNEIKNAELLGVIKYNYYAGIIVGPERIALASWFKDQAQESLEHAGFVNEYISFCGGDNNVNLQVSESSDNIDLHSLLSKSLKHEEYALGLYKDLLLLVENKSLFLEEYARKMIVEETSHINDFRKLIRM